ncbi:NAD(P)H-dependent flavin oxidoreductase [Brevibacterium otitidis]|uniref:NAD(P)H-dependent flavin oxidoreductase n=1 Tax=Brevibacterium otitidis TaxID=53364 RepID=A0ABV5X0U1_9MICO|nr:nitronate monooxygenase family protein [Brevibacterium otitidis]
MALPEVLTRPLRLPVIASPMFIASGPQLVTAQCQAGVIGAFPTLNARPAELLDEWLHEIGESNEAFAKANPDKPVGAVAANLIVHRSNNRIEADLEMIVKHQVPIVITSLGARTEVNDAVHSYGGIVLHDVIHNGFAHKAIEKGADGLILVAAGAGGHAGMLSPFAFLNEVRAWFDGPIALSGAVAHGRSVLAAQAAGADFAYVGSAFLATPEAQVTDEYRQMIVDSTASDIVYTNLFTGVHGNYLRGSIEAAGLDPDNLPESDPSKMNFGSGGSEKSKAWRDIWGSGQGIGTIDESLPAGELVARLADEYEAAKSEMLATLGVSS